jgi:hypothetical protein
MSISLSEDERAALLRGEPVRLSDPQLGGDVVVSAEWFESIQDLARDEREQAAFRAFARKQAAALARENPY